MTRIIWFEGHQGAGLAERTAKKPAGERRGYLSAWFILAVLSVIFLAWIILRWLFRPPWLASVPGFIIELFDLAEMASAITLVVLWAGLLWRRRQPAARPPLAMSLDELYALSPKAFEHFVAGLFRRKGFRVVVRGRSGDHGVDLVVYGQAGRQAVVQCKRYQKTVGEEIVRDLFGTLVHERVSRAFLVTTADISDAAREWANGKPITLIDGQTLVEIAAALAARQGQ